MLNQVTLSGPEYLQGAFTLIFVIVSLILGIILISKYFKDKRRQLFLVGLTWLLLTSPYWPDAINFMLIIATGNEINEAVYFFVANGFIAPLHVTWGLVFTDFIYKEKQKLLMIILTAEAILFETIFVFIFITDYHQIGTKLAPFIVEWTLFVMVYLLVSIALFLIMGILFVRESLNSENKEAKVKGRFLLVAFITFAIGTVIDVLFAEIPMGFTIVLARTFGIVAAFAFYIGFTLPQFIKNILIKE